MTSMTHDTSYLYHGTYLHPTCIYLSLTSYLSSGWMHPSKEKNFRAPTSEGQKCLKCPNQQPVQICPDVLCISVDFSVHWFIQEMPSYLGFFLHFISWVLQLISLMVCRLLSPCVISMPQRLADSQCFRFPRLETQHKCQVSSRFPVQMGDGF